MSDDILKMLSLVQIDQMHDPDLSEALGRWMESQEVEVNKSAVACLRIAAVCVARLIHKNPPPKAVECDIIEAYADYFHYYVHVSIGIIEDEKNKSRGRK